MKRRNRARTAIEELKRKIADADKAKKEYSNYLKNLRENYSAGKIPYSRYVEILHEKRSGRNIKEWIEYLENYEKRGRREIKHHKRKILHNKIFGIFLSIAIVSILISLTFYIQPSFTGFVVQENISEAMIKTEPSAISTTQYDAVLNQPVKWKKEIHMDKPKQVKVRIPKEAENITVNKVANIGEYSGEINKEVSQNQTSPYHEEPLASEKEKTSKFTITGAVVSKGGFFRNIFRKMTGAVTSETSEEKEITINDIATGYEIEYETPAPTSKEQPLTQGNGKIITITGSEIIHYKNVLAFTALEKEAPKEKIKLYKTTGEIKEPVKITNYIDEDNNGLIEKIEWLVPQLSEQTYELIIEISKAEHLDENKNFISDIYEQVKKLDDIWSEPINNNEYVRVTFREKLDKTKDITIFPRIVSETPTIEVYEVGSDSKIAEFTSLNSNQYNKVFLTNLQDTQDTFDLKIVSGSVEFEHIVDPTLVQYYLIGGDITGAGGVGKLQTSTGNAKAIWQTNADGQSYTWTKQYTETTTLNIQTFVIGFWCNATTTAGGDKVEVDDFYVYDCGLSADCSSQDATVCSVTVQNIACDFATAATFNTISCTSVTSRTLNANDYLGVMLVADINDLKNPDLILHFNNSVFKTHFNVTETPPDLTYPQFNSYVSLPANNTAYSQNAVYRFNSTVTNTNGTVGLEFDSVNYTATNVSNNFTASVTDLSAGIYSYYWWGFGNGTDKNYNVSDMQSYTVSLSGQSITPLLNGNNANLIVTYPQQINASFTGTNQTALTININGTTVNKATNYTWQAGGWVVNYSAPSNQNYSLFSASLNLTVNQAIPQGNLTNQTAWTITYGTAVNMSYQEANAGDSDVTYKIFRDNIDATAEKSANVTLGVGTYTYKLNTTGGQNWTANSSMDIETLVVNIATGQINGTINAIQGNFSAVNGTANQNIWLNATNITGYGTGKIYVNGSLYNSGTLPLANLTNLSIGFYNATFIYDGNTNYTSDDDVWWVNITLVTNQAPNNPQPNLTSIDGTNSSATNLNCTASITDPDSGDKLNVTIRWYNNSQLAVSLDYNNSYASGTLFSAELDSANTTANQYWNCSLRVSDSLTSSNWGTSVNLTILNTAPRITIVYNQTINVQNGPNEAPASTGVVVNFSVYDADETIDLNDSSARVNITYPNQAVRENLTCSKYQSSGYYANYSCGVTMWWWDGTGSWNITAFIADNNTNTAQNSSTNFYVGLRTSFSLGPSVLTWPGLAAGQLNRTSLDVLLLNNTGNDAISLGEIGINATNLVGEQDDTLGLWAGNISVNWSTGGTPPAECGGTMMNASFYTNITGANLSAGNYTANNGAVGQEQLYFCLKLAGSELTTQPYSTTKNGAWTIRILLVAVIPASKRKKKQRKIEDDKLIETIGVITDELKEKYKLSKSELVNSLIKEMRKKYKINREDIMELAEVKKISIPATIFSKELGALESLVKYMKENLNMNYSEIAKELGRDERTIWTSYKKAKEKQPEEMKIKETGIFLPISIFENKSLTVLESVIIYLKEKGMKYSEIAELLSRDQRNIWTVYSRAARKLKED